MNIIHPNQCLDKTIKLWKIGQRRRYSPRAVSSFERNGQLRMPEREKPNDCESSNTDSKSASEDAETSDISATPLHAVPKKVFSNAHAYHINSLATNSDGETFVSADDLRINWWDLEISDTCFSKFSTS